jgi:serine/threonine protein kinase
MRNFWRARGDLHKTGFSHNDMHGGNVFVDPDTGEVQIIDLGLAKEDKLSALMEGLGGLDFEEGEDYQLTHHLGGANFSDRMQEMSVDNRANVEQDIMDNLDIDMEDEEAFDGAFNFLQSIMKGDIRMKDQDFEGIKRNLPYLADDENVGKLIKMLYEGIGNSELADRMGDAFERKQKDSKVLRAANLMRKKRGESEITARRDVIPPKNMDFDD